MEIFSHDVTDALRRATQARILPVIFQIVAVVECQFFTGFDVTVRDDPDATVFDYRFAIRFATVIQKPRRIPIYTSVEIERVVQTEDELVVRLATAKRLRLGDLFADVFNDPRARGNVPRRKTAGAMNLRLPENYVLRSDFGWVVYHLCRIHSASGFFRLSII